MARIAVIDDRVTNRNILTRLAASVEEGLSVHAFASPAAALDAIDAGLLPDLIVTDFNMPGMDGAASCAPCAAARSWPRCRSSSSPSTRTGNSATGRWTPVPPISC